jgi:UDP-2,3-diacylglucosamine hydrolase
MELFAPARWRCVDFISDLHLQADEPSTLQTWRHYMQHTAADAVFILGDLFEVWVGDDVLERPRSPTESGFELDCVNVLRNAASRMSVYIMQGNRDFLMGPALMNACGCTLLEDPSILEISGQRWLLTHGDALCVDDTDYMQFRSMVRDAQWQQDFLGQPLAKRLELARQMRLQSEARKQEGIVYADVDVAEANACMDTLLADHMMHGHTHRPGNHALGAGRERWVLSDWDLSALPPRAEVVRMHVPTISEKDCSVRIERISPLSAHLITSTTGA